MKSYTLFALLVTGALASINMVDDMARGLRMNLLPRQQTNSLQVFTSGLGGAGASAITQSNDPTRQFEVDGDTFVGAPQNPCVVCCMSSDPALTWGCPRRPQTDFDDAANRACDNQHNECANIANDEEGAFSVPECDEQMSEFISPHSPAVATAPPPRKTVGWYADRGVCLSLRPQASARRPSAARARRAFLLSLAPTTISTSSAIREFGGGWG